jgi:hypothetical protein
MDTFVIVLIGVAVLVALVALAVLVGSDRQRRLQERLHLEELRREAEFHDARAARARAEAEEQVARVRREEAEARRQAAASEAGEPPRERRFQRDEPETEPGRFTRKGEEEREPEETSRPPGAPGDA